MMSKTVEGIYRNGKIELTETPVNVPDQTPVVVTFLESGHIDLASKGIDETRAADLRARLKTFAEDWDTPEMSVYDNYDDAKPKTR